MYNNHFLTIILLLLSSLLSVAQNQKTTVITPSPYERALRNPMKGFTTRGISNHPWASTAHTYIKWNQLEDNVNDDTEKILRFCDNKWEGLAKQNKKVIPRVYLHWSGDNEKYWPSDMQEDDYTSKQFQERLVRLIKRLGVAWDNDPRVAFIELGIFGKWGEQHSPAPTAAMQKLAGDAFAQAFKNKKVSVRHMWSEFTDQPFGEYWDSWAHYQQMWGHGNSIMELNQSDDRYLHTYIGGEVAYGWGMSDTQPGPSPTASVSKEEHRSFVINSIRWLHCTQLRWIDDYDTSNPAAAEGAEEMQKAFGYRFTINEFRFSLADSLKVSFDVSNEGSAPFYYDWPVEVALLNTSTHKPVWKGIMKSADIREWHPGSNFTSPDWTPSGNWAGKYPDVNWNSSGVAEYTTPPETTTLEEAFDASFPEGNYILSLAVLDPAGNVPSLRFATANYLTGGRHPMGMVNTADKTCAPLPEDFQFDNPRSDNSLYYDPSFDVTDQLEPRRHPFDKKRWQFPGDTVKAWQYDFMDNRSGNKFFMLDSAHTVGLYGCNNQEGVNMRMYLDSLENEHSAQFKWNTASNTFQTHGQWTEYTSGFANYDAYQLLVRTRKNMGANFELSIKDDQNNVIYYKDVNLFDDFKIVDSANEDTEWLLSNFAISELWGNYTVRFDWYDLTGAPGIFGEFAFVESNLDVVPPGWFYVDLGEFDIGTDLELMPTENSIIYMVPAGTNPDITSIYNSAVSSLEASAYVKYAFETDSLEPGDYIFYAIDEALNISEATAPITLNEVVASFLLSGASGISISYHTGEERITIISEKKLKEVNVYNFLGKKEVHKKTNTKQLSLQCHRLKSGVYLIQAIDQSGSIKIEKIIK